MDIFAQRLQLERERKGYKQDEFAKLAGIHPRTYGHYEQGLSTPKYECLVRISNVLDVSIDYLLGKYNRNN